VANACYILFKDGKSHVFYHEKDLDLGILNKGIRVPMSDLATMPNLLPCECQYFYISMKFPG
jgi:hypothetical protein